VGNDFIPPLCERGGEEGLPMVPKPDYTKKCKSKATLLENLPLPLFTKEGNSPSLWKREIRRDFTINVFILIILLVTPPYPSYFKGGDN
jgi:hypothetical protein